MLRINNFILNLPISDNPPDKMDVGASWIKLLQTQIYHKFIHFFHISYKIYAITSPESWKFTYPLKWCNIRVANDTSLLLHLFCKCAIWDMNRIAIYWQTNAKNIKVRLLALLQICKNKVPSLLFIFNHYLPKYQLSISVLKSAKIF